MASIDLLIRNATVVLSAGPARKDVAIADGIITEIADAVAHPAKATIDATGLHLFPGMIDPHVHFNDAGPSPTSRAHWEGLSTGSAALAAGGGTLFFDMPLNASPPTLDGPSFDAKRDAALATSVTDFALWGGLTPQNLDKLEELADRGVIGFKAFMSSSGIGDFARSDDLTLYRGMKIAATRGLIVAVHAESEEITGGLYAEAMARGESSSEAYLNSRPIIAEVEATARAITLAEETGCALHIVHVANSRSSELVRLARTRGVNVTCETCPHYLALSCHDLVRIGARAKCAPPLRAPADMDELWQDLADGKFEFVASDHSPSPPEMKTDANFFKLWGGIAGVQSTLPILLSHGPGLELAKIAALTSANVASRFGIRNKGRIAPGHDADLTLVDIDACYTLAPEMLHDRHKLSPYVGTNFHGRIVRTLLRGQTVFHHNVAKRGPVPRLIRPA